MLPLCYCLLPDKSNATYVALFNLLRQRWPNFQPRSASIDFEYASITALQQVFPGIEIFGCLFHLVKNLKKHLGDPTINLIARYNADADFALKVKTKIINYIFDKAKA